MYISTVCLYVRVCVCVYTYICIYTYTHTQSLVLDHAEYLHFLLSSIMAVDAHSFLRSYPHDLNLTLQISISSDLGGKKLYRVRKSAGALLCRYMLSQCLYIKYCPTAESYPVPAAIVTKAVDKQNDYINLKGERPTVYEHSSAKRKPGQLVSKWNSC